jgi:hypothetical protein
MKRTVAAGWAAASCLLTVAAVSVTAQQPAKDPGVRGGPPGAGGTIYGLTSDEKALFEFLTSEFVQAHSITGDLPNEAGNGLGPGYNANGCGICHSFPAFGGSSPLLNPQIAQATLDGATNKIPSFISLNGPVREARFVRNPDGTPDGGVHNLFTIQGRVDAPGCQIAQPDFATELSKSNVIFRIPSPMFGAGLIENIWIPRFCRSRVRIQYRKGRWESPATRIATPTTGRSPDSDGKRRISR